MRSLSILTSLAVAAAAALVAPVSAAEQAEQQVLAAAPTPNVILGKPAGEITLKVLNTTTGEDLGCLSDTGMWTAGPPFATCGVFNVTEALPEISEPLIAALANFTLTEMTTNATCSFGTPALTGTGTGGGAAVGGSFTCSTKAKAAPTFFQADTAKETLVFNATDVFYSPMKPFGWMRMPILSAPTAFAVSLHYEAAPVPPAGVRSR